MFDLDLQGILSISTIKAADGVALLNTLYFRPGLCSY